LSGVVMNTRAVRASTTWARPSQSKEKSGFRGTSRNSAKGAHFYDPEADKALFDTVKENLDEKIPVIEVDTHINDPVFADKLCELMASLLPV
jgi:hypothetical protein